jgi:acyl-CoA thioester hydrolase
MARETRTRLQLRWRDLDQLGHVNQSVYHELLEEGRGALFAPLIESPGGFRFVLARVELDYRHEVRLADREVEVVSRVARLGRSSVTLEQEIRLADGALAAAGTSVLVAWDGEARGSRALTEIERERLSG